MRSIQFTRVDNIITATPAQGCTPPEIYGLFDQQFRFYRKEKERGRGKTKMRIETYMLLDMRDDQVLFPVGLLPRAFDICKKHGVGTDLKVVSKPALPTPDLTRITPCDDPARADDQRKVLASIFTSDFGIIKAPTAFGKTYVLVEVVAAYPNLNIIICTRRRDVVQMLKDRLDRRILQHELGVIGAGQNDPRRITIVTQKSLKRAPIDKCDLLLYDEVHEAASRHASPTFSHFRNARMFGFSASPWGRSDGSDRLTEAIFGPVISEVTYQEAQKKGAIAQIDVHIYPVPGGRLNVEEVIAQYRWGIWRNDVRNRMAAGLAAQDAKRGAQVLILVDKIEHGLRIRKHLRSWPFVYANMSREQRDQFIRWGLMDKNERILQPEQRDNYRRQFESGHLRYAIATGVWNTGVDFQHLDVLIRADGTSGPISNTQTPGRLSRGKHGILRDFNDAFDDRFANRGARRLMCYRGKGWKIHMEPYPMEAVKEIS